MTNLMKDKYTVTSQPPMGKVSVGEQSTPVSMSSIEIAELTGKRHADVLRDIKMQFITLYCEDEVSVLVEQSKSGARKSEIAREYCDSLLKGLLKEDGANWRYLNNTVIFDEREYVSLINLDYEHTMTLVSGYNVKLRNAIVKRWQELEAQVKEVKPVITLPDFTNPAESARAWALEYEQKQQALKQLELAAPKIQFVDEYVDTTGSKSFREVSNVLKANERAFRKMLQELGMMYQKKNKQWAAYSKFIDNKMMHSKITVDHDTGRSYTLFYFTPLGIEYCAKKWNERNPK